MLNVNSPIINANEFRRRSSVRQLYSGDNSVRVLQDKNVKSFFLDKPINIIKEEPVISIKEELKNMKTVAFLTKTEPLSPLQEGTS